MWLATTHESVSQVLRNRAFGRIWTDWEPAAEMEPFNAPHRNQMMENEPRVLGRLVLHHLVAVQRVERLHFGGRLPVGPEPAERARAQDLADRLVRRRQPHAHRLVPQHRSVGPQCREDRVGIAQEVRIAGIELDRVTGQR